MSSSPQKETKASTPAHVRARAFQRLSDALDSVTGKRVESCVWNWTLRSFLPSQRLWDNPLLRYRYTTKILSMEFNLKNPKNPGLRERVLSGTVTPVQLVSMSPYAMFPEMWEPVFERVAHKQLRRQLTVDVDSAPDGLLQCRKCRSKKTSFVQMQTRSADEPMTVFAYCLACQCRWKQ